MAPGSSTPTKELQYRSASGKEGRTGFGGKSKYGDAAPPTRVKAKFCMYHLQGVCKYSDNSCAFAHSPEELRPRTGGRRQGRKARENMEHVNHGLLQIDDAPYVKDRASTLRPPPGLDSNGNVDRESMLEELTGAPPPHPVLSAAFRRAPNPTASATAPALTQSRAHGTPPPFAPAAEFRSGSFEPMKVSPISCDPTASALQTGGGILEQTQGLLNSSVDAVRGLQTAGVGISSADLLELSQSLGRLNAAISNVAAAGGAIAPHMLQSTQLMGPAALSHMGSVGVDIPSYYADHGSPHHFVIDAASAPWKRQHVPHMMPCEAGNTTSGRRLRALA